MFCSSYKAGFSFSQAVSFSVLIISLLLPFEQMVWAGTVLPVRMFSKKEKNTIPEKKSIPGNVLLHQSSARQAFGSTHKFHTSLLTHLPVMSNGDSGIVSNANNFHGAADAAVDPRTGNVSFSMTAASMLYDNGQATRKLTLAYAGGPAAGGLNAFALGSHWSWNVGLEHRSPSEVEGHLTTSLTLSTGHSFTMESDRDSGGGIIWHPLRHKLGDVTFAGHPGDWTVTESTGLREHILNGYEDWEENSDGQRVYFYYDREGSIDSRRRLLYVCSKVLTQKEIHGETDACAGSGVRISWQGEDVTVHGRQRITLHRQESGGIINIQSISMPSLSSEGISNSHQQAVIHLLYDEKSSRPWLLSQVSYPVGLTKTFLYNEESHRPGAQFHGLAVGIHGATLPVVTEVITQTGDHAAASSREWYRYSTRENGGSAHNYTGYQGERSVIPGRDNLFDRPGSYTYSVEKDNGLTTTRTTYNKYHLPLLVEQRSNRQNSLIAQSAEAYPPWKNTVFSDLPANYSMPVSTTKTLYAVTETGQEAGIEPVKIIESKRYNKNGQTIWKKDSYGRITMTQYCPPEGDRHCPVMDKDRPQITQPEKMLIIPSHQLPAERSPLLSTAATQAPAPAQEVVFDYQAIPTRMAEGSTAPPSHLLRVKAKMTGTVPLSEVSDLRAGSVLPELNDADILSKITYDYNTRAGDVNYGQITHLSITKPKDKVPVVNGRQLLFTSTAIPATPRNTFSIDVDNSVNVAKGTRSTTMKIAPGAAKKPSNGYPDAAGAGPVVLGTSTYSLITGARVSSQDTMKEIREDNTYDNWGRLIKKTVTPVDGGRALTTRRVYINTVLENAVVSIGAEGKQSKIIYNGLNQVVSTWHRFADQSRQPLEGTAHWIPDATYSYTPFGKKASSTLWHAADPEAGLPGEAIALSTTYGYDALNRLVWTRGADGVIGFAVRDDPHMRVIRYEVATKTEQTPGALFQVTESNILGKPVSSYIFPLDASALKHGKPLYTEALQQELKTLLSHASPASALQSQNSYGLLPVAGRESLPAFIDHAIRAGRWLTHTAWQYDGNGRVVKKVMGNGATTRWQYSHGNLVATVAPDGRIIHDTYDVRGKKTSRCVQPRGSTRCHISGTRGYSSEGDLIWQADEYGRVIHYTRDADGRMISMKTPASKEAPEGHTFTWYYNSLGKTEADIDGAPYVKYTYDPVTWKITDTDDAISHVHNVYDSNTGALIKIIRSAPRSYSGITPLKNITYPTTTESLVYDRYMQPVSTTDAAGNTVKIKHDRLGRAEESWVKLRGDDRFHLLAKKTYDHFSRLITVANETGMEHRITYNAPGNIASTSDEVNHQPVMQLDYTYDPDTGNILTMTRREGDEAATQTYTYDRQNNLKSMSCTGQSAQAVSGLCPRDTNLRHSGLNIPPVITGEKYHFDQWNNISLVEEHVVTEGITHTKRTRETRYYYETSGDATHPDAYDHNRLSGYRTQWDGDTFSSRPHHIVYGSSGHITWDAEGNHLHYNGFGQQDAFTNVETGEVTHYTYDSSGHQIAEQSFDSMGKALQRPLYMFYNGNTIIAQMQKDDNGRLHVSSEFAGVMHSEDGVITRWYLNDYKGDIISTFDNQGRRVTDTLYSSYGLQYDRLSHAMQSLPAKLSQAGQLPLWQQHQPGFDGQMSDPATGYQFLGGGYRAYNPVYRHFMTKDSYSPFRKIDGYGFGDNNPIMNTDPTGHMPKWAGYLMAGVGIVFSVASAVLLPVTAAASAGGVAGALAAIPGVAFGVLGSASGSLQVAALKHPGNALLQKVNDGFGIASGIAGAGMGAMMIGAGAAGASMLGNALNVLSGISDVFSGMTGSAASSMGMAAAIDSSLEQKKTFSRALEILGYVSTGFMLSSMALGFMGAGVNAGMRSVMEANDAARITTELNRVYRDRINETLDSKFQHLNIVPIQKKSDVSSLSMVFRDSQWSMFLTEDEMAATEGNMAADFKHYRGAYMRERYAEQVSPENREEMVREHAHYATFKSWYKVCGQPFIDGYKETSPAFYDMIGKFRAEIEYSGPIMAKKSGLQYHSGFIRHMSSRFNLDGE